MKRCSFRVFSFPDFLKPSYPPCYHTTWELPLKNSPLTPWPVFLFFFLTTLVLKHLSKLTLHLWTFYVIFLVSLRCSSLCHLPAVLWLASHSVVFPEIIWVHPDALQHKTTNADPQVAALWFISAWSGMFHSSSWGSGSCYCPGFEDCSEVSCSVEIWAVPLALLFSPTQPPSS